MHILVLDIGGTNVKVWKTGEADKLKVPSGKGFTPEKLVAEVKEASADWAFDRVSIGYPGDVLNGRPVSRSLQPRATAGSGSISPRPSAARCGS